MQTLTATVLSKWNSIFTNSTFEWIPYPLTKISNLVGWANQIWSWFCLIWFYLFVAPVVRLILQGPWLGGYGFWNGMTAPEICSRLGGGHGPTAEHYIANPPICLELIERDIQAKLVLFDTVLYIFLILTLASAVWHRLIGK